MIKRGNDGRFKGKKDKNSVAKAIKANMKNGIDPKTSQEESSRGYCT